VFSLIAPIVAERILGGSAALLAALTFPSHFAENKALMRACSATRLRGAEARISARFRLDGAIWLLKWGPQLQRLEQWKIN
jgi:hypothetical protein